VVVGVATPLSGGVELEGGSRRNGSGNGDALLKEIGPVRHWGGRVGDKGKIQFTHSEGG